MFTRVVLFLACPGAQVQKLDSITDFVQPTSEQLHSLWLVAPAGEVAPAGHESQTVMPVVGAKEPAGHCCMVTAKDPSERVRTVSYVS